MEKTLRDKKTIFMFVGPAFILFISVLLLPIAYGLYLSFCEWNGIGAPKFIGVENYSYMLTQDMTFGVALKNSLFFLISSLVLQQTGGLILALILTNGIRHRNFFKNVYYFPAILSGTAVGLMWGFIFDTRMGAINALLRFLGLEPLARMWLVETKGFIPLPMWCIALVCMWQFTGTMMMLFIAGILDIPAEMLEASYIDGAGRLQTIRHITLPLLRPMIRVSMVLSCVGSLKFFDLIFTMTGGGPSHLTEVLATHMYQQAFTMWRYGYGNALAVVLVLLCVLATVLINKMMSGDKYDI